MVNFQTRFITKIAKPSTVATGIERRGKFKNLKIQLSSLNFFIFLYNLLAKNLLPSSLNLSELTDVKEYILFSKADIVDVDLSDYCLVVFFLIEVYFGN